MPTPTPAPAPFRIPALVLVCALVCLSAGRAAAAADILLVDYAGTPATWVVDLGSSTGVTRTGMLGWVVYTSGLPWSTPGSVEASIRDAVCRSAPDLLSEPYLGYDAAVILSLANPGEQVTLLTAGLVRGLANTDYVLCRHTLAGLVVAAPGTRGPSLAPVVEFVCRLATRPKSTFAANAFDDADIGPLDALLAVQACQAAQADGGGNAAAVTTALTNHAQALRTVFADAERIARTADAGRLAAGVAQAITTSTATLQRTPRQWEQVVKTFQAWRDSGYWTTRKVVVAKVGHGIPLIETQTNPTWTDMKSSGRKIGETVRNADRAIARSQVVIQMAQLCVAESLAAVITAHTQAGQQLPEDLVTAAQAFQTTAAGKGFIAEAETAMAGSEDVRRSIRRWGFCFTIVNTAANEFAKPEEIDSRIPQR